MAWRSNKDENDITLEELGFSSKEELKVYLAKVKTLEEVNTGLNTTVTAQQTELATVKGSLADLEGKFTTLTQHLPQNPQNPQNPQSPEIPSVADDENAAFAVRMAPLYESNMTNTAIIMEDRVLRRIALSDPLFPKIEVEVRELIAKTPLQIRSNTDPRNADKNGRTVAEQVIENAYYVVKGRKADQIRTDAIAQKGEFFIEPARSSQVSGSSQQDVREKTVNDLSADDRKIIERMGVKPETYVKLINDGGPQMGGALVNKTGL